jgi:hypothetical protein
MKFRRDSTKGEMMDEREIAEKAWREGAFAVQQQRQRVGAKAVIPENPYAPVVYTPTSEEIRIAIGDVYTGDELYRYQKKRDDEIAEYERGMVVEELQRLRSVDVDPLVVQTINHCVGMIRRMKG